MQLSPGVRIRSFEILAPLGAGGMGAVYRAHDGKLGRDVAIKILQDKLIASREYLARFKREARAASALNHPNIITIFEIDECDGAPFIAMELIDGTSLRDVLRKGPLPMRKLLDVATQIAEGLAAAHEQNIVHRDLKPENVMLTSDGRVKILDFGLARVSRSAGADVSTAEITSVHTPQGRVLGTASYVSPEQASGSADLDFRSDQFSFGSIVYELATGRKAFERGTAMETLAAIMRDEPEPMQQLTPRTPPQLCWIVDRCLAKDAGDRYASTRDLARELRTLRERLPETSPGNRIRTRLRTSPRQLAGAAVLALIVAASVAALVYRSTRARAGAPQLPAVKVIGVLPFEDLTGRPGGRLFSEGFSEAVRARLRSYGGIQVTAQDSAAALIRSGASVQRIAQELGATLLVRATVQGSSDRLRVVYSLLDARTAHEIAGRSVDGAAERILALQDEVAAAIARDLGIQPRSPPASRAGLETREEQEIYLRALGALEHADDLTSIDTAVALLHDLLETSPNAPLVHAALGRAYYLKYSHTFDHQWSEKAVRACNRASALDPDSPDTLVTLATVESLLGQYEASIATFQRAIALQPASAIAMIGLAKAYSANGQERDAEQAFRRGIALNPLWWFGHNELATMFMSAGRYDDALTEFREVIRLAPATSWGYTNAGAVLFTKGRLDEAAAMFTKATVMQQDAGAWLNLGSCHFFLGHYDKAVECDRKAVAIRSGVSTYWIELGDAYTWSTHSGEAPAAYATAAQMARNELSVNPKNARAHAALAIATAKAGDFRTARRSILRAMELQPENPQRFYEAARVANLAGDDAEAASWLKRALASGSFAMELERHPEFSHLRETQPVRDLLSARKRT